MTEFWSHKYMSQCSKYNLFCMHYVSLDFCTHTTLSLFHFWFKLHFLPSNLHLYSADTPFVNVYDSFFPVNTLQILKFKCYIVFRTHTLLDRSLRVLQLQKQPTRVVLKKRCSENMQQIYKTTYTYVKVWFQ